MRIHDMKQMAFVQEFDLIWEINPTKICMVIFKGLKLIFDFNKFYKLESHYNKDSNKILGTRIDDFLLCGNAFNLRQ